MTKDYPQQVEFYAVSCQEHKDVCLHHSIEGYPALVTFGAGSNLGRKLGGKYTESMLAKILELKGGASPVISRRMQAGSDEEEVDNGNNDQEAESKEENDSGDKEAVDEDEDQDDGDKEEDQDDGDKEEEDQDTDAVKVEDKEEEDQDTGAIKDSGENKNSEEDKDGNDKEPVSQEDPPESPPEDPSQEDELEEASDVEAPEEEEEALEDAPAPRIEAANRPGFDDRAPVFNNAGIAASNNGNILGRHSGAGAAKARFEKKDMDRWKAQIAEQKKLFADRRNGFGNSIAPPKTSRSVRNGRPVPKAKPEEMTTNMKARTPGTAEYEERRKILLERIAKNKARREGTIKARPGSTIVKETVFKKESLPFSKNVRKQNFVSKQAAKVPIVKRFIKMSHEEALINDASLSFVAGLHYGVFKNDDPLTPARKSALKNWLDFLSVSLPPEWGLHRVIDDLRRQINFVAQSDKNLRAVLRTHPMPREFWSESCTGGRRQVRKGNGFSCGFWKLLHVATVGVAEHKGGLNLVDAGMIDANHKTFAPIEAADTIKDYMEKFYNCEECSSKFVEHYNDCNNNRRCDRLTDDESTATIADWKELALWMWEVHNEVSVRIVGEKREKIVKRFTRREEAGTPNAIALAQQSEVMVIWPTLRECLACFEADGTWDEPEVFTRLEYTYWYVQYSIFNMF